MKKNGLLFVFILILLLSGCSNTSESHEKVTLASLNLADICSFFLYDEVLFSIHNVGRDYYLVENCFQSKDEAEAVFVTSVDPDYSAYHSFYEAGPFWQEEAQTICYTKNCSIYSLDIDSKESVLLWSLPKATKKDYIQILCHHDQWALVMATYGEKNTGHDRKMNPYLPKKYQYFAYNFTSGESVSLCSVTFENVSISDGYSTTLSRAYYADNGYYSMISPLCIAGDELYYLQRKTKGADLANVETAVLKTNLATLKTIELGILEDSPHTANGILLKDQLYFSNGGVGVYSLGDHETNLSPSAPEVEGFSYTAYDIMKITEYQGQYYLALKTPDFTKTSLYFFGSWSPEDNRVTPLFTAESETEYIQKAYDYFNSVGLLEQMSLIR